MNILKNLIVGEYFANFNSTIKQLKVLCKHLKEKRIVKEKLYCKHTQIRCKQDAGQKIKMLKLKQKRPPIIKLEERYH